MSSVLGRGGGSSFFANARPAATVSAKLMSAMPRAPGQSSRASPTSGTVIVGNPAGIAPTSEMPELCSANSPTAATAAATIISGAGQRGRSFSMTARPAIVNTPIARVGIDV